MLLDSGVHIDRFPEENYYVQLQTNALGIASKLDNLAMVRFLINNGADPMYSGISIRMNSPIYIASRCGHERIVVFLLDLGADAATALYGACEGGQVHLVRLLYERYPDIISTRRLGHVSQQVPVRTEVLRLAICIKNPSLISLLIHMGASLNDGYTEPRYLPIIVAKTKSAKWITDFLLSLGAIDQELSASSPPQQVERYLEKLPEREKGRVIRFNYTQRGGILITKRTWEWVGNC